MVHGVNPGKLKYVQEYPNLLRTVVVLTISYLQCHEGIDHYGLENTLKRVRCDY